MQRHAHGERESRTFEPLDDGVVVEFVFGVVAALSTDGDLSADRVRAERVPYVVLWYVAAGFEIVCFAAYVDI